MAFGKGTFTTYDKILPGMYINVEGEAQVGSDMGSRGKAAIALELNWGEDTAEIVKVTASKFYTECYKLFGYKFSAPEMSVLRQVFAGATEVYVYRLNGEGGTAATSTGFASAKYKGTRGNDIRVVVSVNVDEEEKFDVVTVVDEVSVDRQIGVDATTLKDNDWVIFEDDLTLEAGTKTFTGGANASSVGVASHNDFLSKLESYQVNAVGCISEDEQIQAVYAAWVKNQRDIYGNCIQGILYNQAADHEGIINVDDSVALVPWVLGKEVGCALNASLQNVVYDGEVALTKKNYTQSELESAITNGKFVIHRVGDEFRVLADINSLVKLTGDKTEDFKLNQCIRVVDQISVDARKIWENDFIGKVPSNDSGRISFWNRMVTLLNEYVGIGAVEPFDSAEVVVLPGVQKNSVILNMPVTIATMLEKAYVTIVIQ